NSSAFTAESTIVTCNPRQEGRGRCIRQARSFAPWVSVLVVGPTIVSSSTQRETGRSRREGSPSIQPTATSGVTARNNATRATVEATYGKLPLHFKANQGQSDPQVQFLARGNGYTLFLTATEAVLALRNAEHMANGRTKPKQNDEAKPPYSSFGDQQSLLSTEAVLRMQLVDANPQPHVTGEDELPGKSNYFFGNDPAQWHTSIPTYTKVRYENVYPGVDLVYYSNQGQLEYDFIITPDADPYVIRLAFNGFVGTTGHAPLHIDTNSDLVLQI